MSRISIKSLMLYVSFIAVGLAALRNANGLWVGITLLLAITALGTGILAVIHRKGRERAWWIGFSLFEAGYLVLAASPWLPTIEPSLVTSQLFRYLYQRVTNVPVEDRGRVLSALEANYFQRLDAIARIRDTRGLGDSRIPALEKDVEQIKRNLVEVDSDLVRTRKISIKDYKPSHWLRLLMPGLVRFESFSTIGHYLSALLAGLIGSFISSRMYREPEQAVS